MPWLAFALWPTAAGVKVKAAAKNKWVFLGNETRPFNPVHCCGWMRAKPNAVCEEKYPSCDHLET